MHLNHALSTTTTTTATNEQTFKPFNLSGRCITERVVPPVQVAQQKHILDPILVASSVTEIYSAFGMKSLSFEVVISLNAMLK